MSTFPPKAPSYPDALRATAERFGTPTYAYAASIVRRQCRRLRTLTEGLPTRLMYAMKANPAPAILDLIRAEGFGLDVVSPAELLVALRLGFAPDALLFSASGMTEREMRLAVTQGVLPNIGDLAQLEVFGKSFPGERVSLRINPKIGAGHHAHVVTAGKSSKFGIPLSRLDAARELLTAHDLRLVGLHQHIGSGLLEASALGEAVQVLIDTARTFEGLEFINIGGGLGTPDRPDQTPLPVDNFQTHVVERLRAFVDETPQDLTVRLEPGRFLVAEAGTLLTRVTALKTVGDRTFALTDSGMNHLIRPALYDAYHAVYNLSNPDGAPQTYDVVGNICESGDAFARSRPVQTIRPGDVLALLDTGAYGMAMASHYNLRALPAEVMIRPDGTLDGIRERLSDEDVAARWLQPSRPASSVPS